MKHLITAAFFLLTTFQAYLAAQTVTSPYAGEQFSTVIHLRSADTVYQLHRNFLLEGSERVVIDSSRLLERGRDYTIHYTQGTIIFHREFSTSLSSDSLSHSMNVTARIRPIGLKHEYFLRQIEVRKDSTQRRKVVLSQPTGHLFSDEYFGSGLQKSGSILRGFSVGSNRDLSLSSGFRMQLSGKLAQDVDVTAALTDENSPLQPEGTTQTLREVDKVFVEIKHPRYSAILGDFNVQIDQNEGGEFGRLNRKLQGAQGNASFNQIGSSGVNAVVSLTAATARGKYAANQLQGIEGMQGPYVLKGKNGETRLIIIAGSERVYLNGEELTRGEVNDYTIDYSSGEITFSSKRFITAASRITVDFEYSDQQFVRNLVGGSVKTQALGKNLDLNVSFTQEADDPDSPIDFSLNDSTRAVLQKSGPDRMKASLSGIVQVERGRGQYLIRDTLLSGKTYRVLIYAPGDTLAVYLVTFSQVEKVPADSAGYDRVAAGRYQFSGIGKGNYLPVKFLPMPQLHQVMNVNGKAVITSDLSVSAEYAASRFEQNRLSTLSESNLTGKAFTFAARYNPKQILIGSKSIGELDARISARFVDRYFFALDRTNEVEFNRKWNIAETETADEEIKEMSLAYRPLPAVRGAFQYGALDRSGQVHSTRTQMEFELADSILPKTQYQIELINASNSLFHNESKWIRQKGTMEYTIAGWRPGIRVEAEERNAKSSGLDSLHQGSFRYLEFAPRVAAAEFLKMAVSAELQFRTEDSAASGSLRRALQSLTQLYTWQLQVPNASSTLSLSLRSVEYSEEFQQHGNLNTDAVLIRSQTRVTPFQRAVETDLYYEFSNQRSARLERVFMRVTPGSGNYRYLGDQNANGITDEQDFELTRFDGEYVVLYLPSDQLYPVADIKASIRLRLQPIRLISSTSGWLNKVIRALSTETYVRVDEKSKEPDTKQIYLLHFSRFLNGQTTITGSQQITQDIFVFENNPDLSFRFRFNERSGLTQFVSAVERSYLKEQSIRIRSQLIRELGNQTEYINKIDRVTASSRTSRERDLSSNTFTSDFSYRPMNNWEIGFVFSVSEILNHVPSAQAAADVNEEAVRIVQSFPGVGQLRAEVKREEVLVRSALDPAFSLPFEFTAGKAIGLSYLWQAAFDYRITANMQISCQYNGRSEGGRPPVHFVRMEAKAFF